MSSLRPRALKSTSGIGSCFNIGGMIGRGDLDYATAFSALVAAACAMPTYRDPWRNLDERVARSIKAGMVRLPFS